jgi:predicted nucleic acid-binding protein
VNAEAAVYLDSSALVKLVVLEPESSSLAGHLRQRRSRVSCALARVEVVRAVRGHGRPAINRARALLARISLLRIDDALLDEAAALDGGAALRSLDAIHLAAAQALGDGLAEVVTYDQRMAEAARQLGLHVVAPA